jgi:hypothetical protein
MPMSETNKGTVFTLDALMTNEDLKLYSGTEVPHHQQAGLQAGSVEDLVGDEAYEPAALERGMSAWNRRKRLAQIPNFPDAQLSGQTEAIRANTPSLVSPAAVHVIVGFDNVARLVPDSKTGAIKQLMQIQAEADAAGRG